MKSLRPYQEEALLKIRKNLKESDNPILVNASVGAGKSLILSELLLLLQRANMSALCLTLNSTLIKQNANTYQLQNGHCSIYCAALKSKCSENLIVFGSPNSICKGIRNKEKISRKPFQLIVIDEAHQINPHDNSSMYMRIINHYSLICQEQQLNFRVVGLTGTPYRGKNIYIVGDNQLFKEEVVTISSNWLIKEGFLVKPEFGINHVDSIDFKDVHVENTGKFRHKDLEMAIHKDERLTGKIMHEVVSIRESNRYKGAFIFAATKQHCQECLRSLPQDEAAIITGDTPHDTREKILMEAREGRLKYLISVNCLMVGVDVPAFDICVWVRPTESLILFTQGIGRVLRLHPGKQTALILDYAGNVERHGELDDPIINQAIQQKRGEEQEFCIPCFSCNTLNKPTTRRCIGVTDDKRCENFFEWKNCHHCGVVNDKTSRYCRECEGELVDPNSKLKIQRSKKKRVLNKRQVFSMRLYIYSLREGDQSPGIKIRAEYECGIRDEKSKSNTWSYAWEEHVNKNIIYAKFFKKHFKNPSKVYKMLDLPTSQSKEKIAEWVKNQEMIIPRWIHCYMGEVVKKEFDKTGWRAILQM